MIDYKQKLIDLSTDLGIDDAWITPVLEDNDFLICSSSAKPEHHHYGDGGLIKHTWEVVNLCMVVSEQYPRTVCKRLAYISALYHDYGKIYDYDYTEYKECVNNGKVTKLWNSTQHKYKIHHIPRSYAFWQEQYNFLSQQPLASKFTQDEAMEISHAILAHHGHHEYHSPVEPRTKLAFLLHYCDAISARMDDCDRLYPSN